MLLLQQIPIITEGSSLHLITKMTDVVINYISLFVVVSISYMTINFYNKARDEEIASISVIVLSLISFLIMIPTETTYNINSESINFVLSIEFFGFKGIFSALLISIISVEIYRYFMKVNFTIKMPNNISPMVLQVFMDMIPTFVVIVFWWLIHYIIGVDLFNLSIDVFHFLIKASDNLLVVALIPLLNRGLWSLGIHGGSIVDSLTSIMLMTMNIANQAAFRISETLPYIASGVFYDSYVWNGLAPVSIALMMTKSKKLKTIGRLSLIPAIFNIGEPLMFGLPIVLNPILTVPFILSYVILSIVAYLLCFFKVLAIPYLMIPWTIPAPIKAYLSSGGEISSLVWGIVSWIIVFLVFYPFIKVMEKGDNKVVAD
jgi:Phosphotransferase system cellobiose-specific component IIC